MENTLASRLAALRVCARLTPAELARLTGLKNPSHIGMIERGERSEIAGTTAVELARVLGTSAEFLVAGRGQLPTPEEIVAAVARARLSTTRPVGADHTANDFTVATSSGPVVIREGFDQRTGTGG
jgi:transcriptional regulator with XRE-family HTH domain